MKKLISSSTARCWNRSMWTPQRRSMTRSGKPAASWPLTAMPCLSCLQRAKAGEIHVALGFSSWPAYVTDVVQIVPTDKAERRMLAALMSGEGMSQRAIGAALGVDQKTVSNDLRSGEENSSAVTVGLDGKTYPREQTKPIPERQRPVTDDDPRGRSQADQSGGPAGPHQRRRPLRQEPCQAHDALWLGFAARDQEAASGRRQARRRRDGGGLVTTPDDYPWITTTES